MIDLVALQALIGMYWSPRDVVVCQVFEDGHLGWTGPEPTAAERKEVAGILVDRPGFRGVITLNRESA